MATGQRLTSALNGLGGPARYLSSAETLQLLNSNNDLHGLLGPGSSLYLSDLQDVDPATREQAQAAMRRHGLGSMLAPQNTNV